MNQTEVDKAFVKANGGEKVLMGLVSHDFRDMGKEVDYVRDLIVEAQKKYPDVKFKYATGKEAFTDIIYEGKSEPIELKVTPYHEDNSLKLKVETLKSEVFGPQPYLAVKTKSGRFIHDNFDFGTDGKSWFYTFDFDSILTTDVDIIGVAANNQYGETYTQVLKVGSDF